MIIIPIIIVVLIIVFFVYAQTKKTGQINNVCAILLENNFQVKQKNSHSREILCLKEDKDIAIKLIVGGKNKGIVITNKDTYFMRLYKDANSPHVDSWKLDDVKSFINKHKKEQRIIIVLNGYARITKYINENELEAVTINNDAFGTKVLSLDDFKMYIKGE